VFWLHKQTSAPVKFKELYDNSVLIVSFLTSPRKRIVPPPPSRRRLIS